MGNKRAITTFEILMWAFRIVFLVVVMFAVMTLIRSYVVAAIDTSELEASVFAYRILYSPNAISYSDSEISRAYPGMIDFDRFTSANQKLLEKSVYYGAKNKEVGAKFLLRDLSQNDEFSLFYNEDFFREQKKLAESGFTEGPGGARLYVKKYDVLLSKNNLVSKAILTMEIVIPNS